MKVAFRDNRGKGALIAQALQAAGHHLVEDAGDLALVDHPTLHWELLDRHPRAVLYPHGGNVQLDWDGHLPMHPHVRAALVHGPGHAEVMACYGFGPVCVPVGWCFGPTAEPRYPDRPRRVLFAPAHPSVGGYLPDHLREANAKAFAGLVGAGLEVTVRLWTATAEEHGLPACLGVDWFRGGGLGFDDLDAADVVVSDCGTVAHLALARGVPTVMIGSRHAPDLGHDGPFVPRGWAAYGGLMAYPFDLADGDVCDVLAAACRPSGLVEAYRSRFVGGSFDAAAAVVAVEEVAG